MGAPKKRKDEKPEKRAGTPTYGRGRKNEKTVQGGGSALHGTAMMVDLVL